MKKKMRWWQKTLLIIAVLLLLIIIAFIILFWRVIKTGASVKKLEDGLYSMEYPGDYRLTGFLEAGGASSDTAVADYVIRDVTNGLIDLKLQGYGFGCSTVSASNETGESLFGRNFDWGFCSALIVKTAPPDGYASISTVDMRNKKHIDFVGKRRLCLLSRLTIKTVNIASTVSIYSFLTMARTSLSFAEDLA